eukprot:5090574-Amphidinium_carterae.1
MAWLNPKGVQDLIHSFEAMKALGIQLPMGRRGAPRSNQQAVTPGSKRWSANTGGEEESSVLDHETLGAIGAPTCFRKGPR